MLGDGRLIKRRIRDGRGLLFLFLHFGDRHYMFLHILNLEPLMTYCYLSNPRSDELLDNSKTSIVSFWA